MLPPLLAAMPHLHPVHPSERHSRQLDCSCQSAWFNSSAAPVPPPAGFAYKGDTWGAAEAQATLDTNYFGTAAACEALTPLMGPGSRVINVCSM